MKQTTCAKGEESVWGTVITHSCCGQTHAVHAYLAMQEKHFIVQDQKKLSYVSVNKTDGNLTSGSVCESLQK